mmetsp:Transcript_119259/g.237732  ORF Transcript_119259/g.237732 Transcript_119259/m.237732 type:complete len:481 (+) Transcript_119259:128-1570(+)
MIKLRNMAEAERDHQQLSLAPLARALFAGQFSYMLLTVVGPIKNELSAEFTHGTSMNLNEFEYFYGLMFTVYAIPNFFTPLVAGAMTGYIGARKVLAACSLLNVCAGLFQCIGIVSLQHHIVLCGRLLLGFGNESLLVAVVALLGEVLPSSKIPFMQGMLGAGIFIAIATGSLLAVPILQICGRHGLCVFMFAAALVQFCGNLEVWWQSNLIEAAEKQVAVSRIDCEEIAPLLESSQKQSRVDEHSPPQRVTARGSAIYAVIVFCSSANTICVWNLNMILCPLFLETWPSAMGEASVVAEERAGAWSFLFMMVPAVGSPIVGAAVGALGHPGVFILWSQILQAVGLTIISLAAYHTSLSFFSGPLLPLLLVSASNPLMAPLLYQCITILMPAKHCAKAFGLMTVMQNIVMGLWPLLIAHLRVISGSYQSGTMAFAFTGLIGLIGWCCMMVLDYPRLGGFNTLCKRSAYLDEPIGSRNKGM